MGFVIRITFSQLWQVWATDLGFYSRFDLQQSCPCLMYPLYSTASVWQVKLGKALGDSVRNWGRSLQLSSTKGPRKRCLKEKQQCFGIPGLICGVDYLHLNCMESGLGLACRCIGFDVCRCPRTPLLFKARAGIGVYNEHKISCLPFSLFLHPCKLCSLHGNGIKTFLRGES